MKKIVINKNQCLCCGSCVGLDNEHFDFVDDRFPEVISNENLESNDLNNAICACPTEAISIVEVEENAEVAAEETTEEAAAEEEVTEDSKKTCCEDSLDNGVCECEAECNCGDNCNCGNNCCCHNN